MYEEALKNLNSSQWEFFAGDLLWHIGYEILEGPSEGADQGKDLIVRKGDNKYLVSCKHYINTNKSIGSSIEQNIADRIFRHECNGFIAFYSTKSTSDLKLEFQQLRDNPRLGFDIIEIYQGDVFDIIPTMTGYTLQKYFPDPHNLYHHINHTSAPYLPLFCSNQQCQVDIINKDRIDLSRIQLLRVDNKLELQFGCKQCLKDYGASIIQISDLRVSSVDECSGNVEIYWWEFSQIRYIEEFTLMNFIIEESLKLNNIIVSDDFFKNWSIIQNRVLQILIPPHWGRWADRRRTFEIPERTGLPLTDMLIHIKNNPELEKEIIAKATNRNTTIGS